jgi:CBS domain containing-hemolysin-like protein
MDEYDEEVREQIRKDGDTYVLDGMLSVRDANEHLKLDLPENGGYTTIAGFLMERAGRILQRGDKVEYEGTLFEIERVDRRRITRIRWIPRSDTNAQGASLHSVLGASVLAGQTATTIAVGAEPLLLYLA